MSHYNDLIEFNVGHITKNDINQNEKRYYIEIYNNQQLQHIKKLSLKMNIDICSIELPNDQFDKVLYITNKGTWLNNVKKPDTCTIDYYEFIKLVT
jgi:hypothetical protein